MEPDESLSSSVAMSIFSKHGIEERVRQLESDQDGESDEDGALRTTAVLLVKQSNETVVEQAEWATGIFHRIRGILKSKNALDKTTDSQLQVAAKHTKKMHNAVSYMQKKRLLWNRLNKPHLQSHAHLQGLAPNTLESLLRLYEKHDDATVTRLLSRAISERCFEHCAKHTDAKLESHIKAADITRASNESWKYEKPNSEIISNLVKYDNYDIPSLASAWAPRLRELVHFETVRPLASGPSNNACETVVPQPFDLLEIAIDASNSRRTIIVKDDLFKRTSTTIGRLRTAQVDKVRSEGYMLIHVASDSLSQCNSADCIARVEAKDFVQTTISFIKNASAPTFRGRKEDWNGHVIDFAHDQGDSPASWDTWMEDQLRNPTTSDLQYFVIEPTQQAETWFDEILHPGLELLQRGSLPGINTSYRYISQNKCTPAGLHIEDAHLASLNLLLAGQPKVWLIIPPSEKTKVEELVKKRLRIASKQLCSQFVRHRNILLRPSILKKAKISYSVFQQRANDLVYTEPGAYHQVLNTGVNFAVAINCSGYETYSNALQEYKFCRRSKACGATPLTEAGFNGS